MQAIRDAFSSVAAMFDAADYAEECAIGVWTDDPERPGVTAVVFQRQLFSLTIPDGYKSMSPEDLTDVVNGVLINAYIEWGLDRDRLANASVNARRGA